MILVVLLLTSPAKARLGENKEELVKRLGSIVKEVDEVAPGSQRKLGRAITFEQENWRVTAVLVEGKCQKISYQKLGEQISEELQQHILYVNRAEQNWVEVTPGKPHWKRDDGAVAHYNEKESAMVLQTTAYLDLVEKNSGSKRKSPRKTGE